MCHNPDNVDLNYIKEMLDINAEIIKYIYNEDYITFVFKSKNNWEFQVDVPIEDVVLLG